MPINKPIIIGKRNFKLFLTLVKKPKTLSTIFSYKPKITQITPLLIPGKIAPAPIKNPLIICKRKCINSLLLLILSNSMQLYYLLEFI